MSDETDWRSMYMQSLEIRDSLEQSIKAGLAREMKLKAEFVDVVCALAKMHDKAKANK